MSSTANAASVGQVRSGLRALGESLRRGRRKVCPVLGLIEIETASKSLFPLSVQNVSVCAKSNVGTLVMWTSDQINDHFGGDRHHEPPVELIKISTPVGDLRLLALIVFEDDTLHMKDAHIEGLYAGACGRAGLNAIGRKLL